MTGAGATMSELRGMASRCRRPDGAFEQIFRAFEESEREIFAGYGGKYVQSGATMESLTQPDGRNAIREAVGGEFTFGSRVWYAKFQGTTGKGRHHSPSAIVQLTPGVAARVRAGLEDHIHPRNALGQFTKAG